VPPFRPVAAALLAALWACAVEAAEAPAVWVEFGADGALSVRAVVAGGAACPQITSDGVVMPSVPRGTPDAAFPVQVCEARAPLNTTRLSAGSLALPVLPSAVRRIAVIGDTGCRIAGRAAQDCDNPTAWPFATIAARAAAKRPDLVIHVGDYYYREKACPAGSAGCAGSPHGDNWATWKAELFDPAAPLLVAAPWVTVRGNHELCRRGGQGWFRLLDPYPARADCPDRTEPYRLSLGGLDLLLFDSSDADDNRAPPDKVALYAAQLQPLLAKAAPHAWLVTHRPVWGFQSGPFVGLTLNASEQAALRGHIPANIDLVLSGHVHDFIAYEFGPERPAQLIVGTGGDSLYDVADTPVGGPKVDGMPVRKTFGASRFGCFIMERTATGWDGTFYAPDDAVIARCRLEGRALDCH
jgi:hypothetical protein